MKGTHFMKKILALFLAAMMALGFAACNKPADDNNGGSLRRRRL